MIHGGECRIENRVFGFVIGRSINQFHVSQESATKFMLPIQAYHHIGTYVETFEIHFRPRRSSLNLICSSAHRTVSMHVSSL